MKGITWEVSKSEVQADSTTNTIKIIIIIYYYYYSNDKQKNIITLFDNDFYHTKLHTNSILLTSIGLNHLFDRLKPQVRIRRIEVKQWLVNRCQSW